jgi:SAM-dependent methyltransferase
MHLDAIDLKDFYACPLGAVVRRLLGGRIRARLGELKDMSMFGLGFAAPYLALFKAEARPCGALMPVELGAIAWPEQGLASSVLVDETELPLDDEAADRLLLVHMLEWSEKSRALLREMWRVLKPNGRILIVVPNRRGLWARLDTTPFGYGSPFSRRQLTTLLKEAMFSPEEWEYALYMPPFNWRVLLRWPMFWERLGLVLWPTFSGVILVEATKQVYAAVPLRELRKVKHRRIVPVPAGVTPRGTSSFETGLRPSSG